MFIKVVLVLVMDHLHDFGTREFCNKYRAHPRNSTKKKGT